MRLKKTIKQKIMPLMDIVYSNKTVAISFSILLSLLYLSGCNKNAPYTVAPSPQYSDTYKKTTPADSIPAKEKASVNASLITKPSTESSAPVASTEIISPSTYEPVKETNVVPIANAEEKIIEEVPSVPQKAKIPEEQSFHLKTMEEPAPVKEATKSVTPKILETASIITNMPKAVEEKAKKSKMYHLLHSPIKDGESCVSTECHEKINKAKYAHAPAATGACLVCHANIKKDPPFGLTNTGVELCWGCHKNQKALISNSKILHKIIKDEGCIGCHDSHSSEASKYLLKGEEKDLCVDCHKKETPEFMAKIEKASIKHKPVAEGKCAGCHEPHASNFKKLLKEGPNDIELCFSCHKKKGEEIRHATYKHGPIQEGLCGPCHEPHGGQIFKNLKYNFDNKFYNSFDLAVYSLCFKCHKETVVMDKQTTTLTNFRNGDRNLHYLHVNRKKGRTCLACHEVHMGTQARHVRKSTPFGTWDIPINFAKTETGGKCSANCHVPKEYDRIHPKKLRIDEEEALQVKITMKK